jgi:hypothetical protein
LEEAYYRVKERKEGKKGKKGKKEKKKERLSRDNHMKKWNLFIR